MSEWISVDKYLPGKEIDWCIVITTSTDKEIFSFMALYDHREGDWRYFDDDKGYEENMEVILWVPLPDASLLPKEK